MRLLLIADTSREEALGSKLLRGLVCCDDIKEGDVDVIYTSPATEYSPSMKSFAGKVFYRMAGRRSWEWWQFQKELEDLVRGRKPNLILVTGILPLSKSIFEAARSYGGKTVNYLTDDPWNKIHERKSFTKSLHQYDHIFSTKVGLLGRLKDAGVKSASWIQFGYDPAIHYKPRDSGKEGADVLFIGTGAEERLRWLKALDDMEGTSKEIKGNSWGNLEVGSWRKGRAVVGREYREALYSAKIVLGLVREANGDLSTDRSFEIGAVGACGMYQDTEEHRRLLKGYPEEGFFKTPQELREKIEIVLANEQLQKEMRSTGMQVATEINTYGARLREIIEWYRLGG